MIEYAISIDWPCSLMEFMAGFKTVVPSDLRSMWLDTGQFVNLECVKINGRLAWTPNWSPESRLLKPKCVMEGKVRFEWKMHFIWPCWQLAWPIAQMQSCDNHSGSFEDACAICFNVVFFKFSLSIWWMIVSSASYILGRGGYHLSYRTPSKTRCWVVWDTFWSESGSFAIQ